MNVSTGLDVFDATVRKTHEWLNELMAELGLDDRHLAFVGLRASLQALRDRLTVEEAVQLGAQLPMLIRGVYYEGWNAAGKPVKWHKAEFLDVVRSHFRNNLKINAEEVVRAVFKVLAHRVSQGELTDVQNLLPKDLRSLWPGADRL